MAAAPQNAKKKKMKVRENNIFFVFSFVILRK